MKTAWLALPAVALVVACNEPSSPAAASLGALSASSVSSNGVVNRVSVGGSDQDATNNTDANFSLIAIEMGRRFDFGRVERPVRAGPGWRASGRELPTCRG